MRKLIVICGAAVALSAATIGLSLSASAEPAGARIGPNQVFAAEINGKTGSPSPVVIQMACFGPIVPGETGHPLAGQTLSVAPTPAATGSNIGDTGANGTSIDAFFGPPPPSAASNQVVFHRYVTKRMPTSLVLPCSGSGVVTFVPLPMSPGTGKSASVPVVYVGQP